MSVSLGPGCTLLTVMPAKVRVFVDYVVEQFRAGGGAERFSST
jgi:hypothetical protein